MSKQLSQESAQQASDLNALFTQILLDNKDITAVTTLYLGIPSLHNLALTSTKAYGIYIKLIQNRILHPTKRLLIAYLPYRHEIQDVPHLLRARLPNQVPTQKHIDVTPENAHTFLIEHTIEIDIKLVESSQTEEKFAFATIYTSDLMNYLHLSVYKIPELQCFVKEYNPERPIANALPYTIDAPNVKKMLFSYEDTHWVISTRTDFPDRETSANVYAFHFGTSPSAYQAMVNLVQTLIKIMAPGINPDTRILQAKLWRT